MPRARELAELATSYDSGGLLGFRNRIINGAMVIDQRNNGVEVNPAVSLTYYLDRWYAVSTASSKFKIGQNAGSVTPPAGFTNYLGCTSLSAYTAGTSESFNIQQRIEGLNVADLGWGTANAQTVTLSFWVRSSLTGTFGGSLRNSATDRSYPFTYTISAANTWEQKSVTIPGDTSGTWLTTNGIGINVTFSIGTGATLSGTAGAWAAGNFSSATGATSVVGTNGATFYITGVQLEKGSTATSFDYRPYGTELQLCQRYLPAISSTSTQDYFEDGYAGATTTAYGLFDFLVTPRVPPTGITVSNAGHFTVLMPSGATMVCNSVTFSVASYKACRVAYVGASGLTANQPCQMYFNNASGQLLFTGCEL